jgi:hypothetical protein
MKKVLIAILLLTPALACAENKGNPADFTIAVHVQSSRSIYRSSAARTVIETTQHLDVIIDGKKYALEAWDFRDVLPVGDYKARISKDDVKPDHEYSRVYELQFADGTTRKYAVVGETE